MTRKKAIVVVAYSAWGIAVLFVLLALYGIGERYCYLYPSIDTTYAAGYSEEDFTKLRVGMTMAEVDRIMCKPLRIVREPNSVTRLLYTQDGKALIGDFAWFGRGLYVSGGTVTKIESTIYYD